MRYSGFAAAGALALLIGTTGAATAGSGGFDRAPGGRHRADFGVIQVGGGHHDEWRGHRRHRHHDRHDRGHRHRRWDNRHSRGFPHHHFGYPYYDSRTRYSQPYGAYGHGFRRDCD